MSVILDYKSFVCLKDKWIIFSNIFLFPTASQNNFILVHTGHTGPWNCFCVLNEQLKSFEESNVQCLCSIFGHTWIHSKQSFLRTLLWTKTYSLKMSVNTNKNINMIERSSALELKHIWKVRVVLQNSSDFNY